MGITERARSHPALVVGSRLVQYGFVLIGFLLVARKLGPFDFGLFIAGQGLANFVAPFVDAGGYNLVTRDMSKGMDPREALAPAVATILTLTPVAIALGVAVAALMFPGTALLPFGLLFLAETCLNRLLDLVYAANFACGRVAANATIDLAVGVMRLLMVALVYAIGGGLIAWTAIYTGGTAIVVAAAAWRWVPEAVPAPLPPRRLLDRVRDGFNFAVSTAARSTHPELDRVVLANMAGPAAAGTYGAASRLIYVAIVPFYVFQMAIYPRYFRSGGGAGYRSARAIARRQASIAVPIAIAVALALYFGADLLPLLLGDAYRSVPAIVKIMAPVVVLSAAYEPFGNALNGAGKERHRRHYQVLAIAINLAGNLLLIPHLGIIGSAIAALVSHFSLLMLFVVVARRHLGPATPLPDATPK